MTVGGPPHPQLNGDLLSGEPPSNDGGTAGIDAREEELTPQRPLQLPRVGWGTDDDDDDEQGGGPTTDNDAQHSTVDLGGGMSIPAINQDDGDGDGVVLRALSRNSEGELAPIPENMSMHGAWPDYYPDILGCYDYSYDERKKYRYRRCVDPRYTRRMCAIVFIVFAAVIGSKVSSEMGRKQKQQLPKPKQPAQPLPNNSDNIDRGNPTDNPKVENTETVANEYTDKRSDNLHDDDVYQLIVDTLDPMMFDDSSDWDGSFFHAFEFCGKNLNRVPCPYIAYCPLGPGTAPLGGTRNDFNDSWAPIFNQKQKHHPEIQQTDWVQLGSTKETCQLYSKLYDGNDPPWSHVAKGNLESTAGIARHVMCCLEKVDGAYQGQAGGPSNDPDFIHRPPSLEEDEVVKPIPVREQEGKNNVHHGENNNVHQNNVRDDNAPVATVFHEEDTSYETSAKKYMPVKYDRSTGWTGRSHADAAEFCVSKGLDTLTGYVICPYDAICPLGPGTEPLAGYNKHTHHAWAPVRDVENGDDWVSLKEDNACRKFSSSSLSVSNPWDAAGEDSEEYTRNVICCANVHHSGGGR